MDEKDMQKAIAAAVADAMKPLQTQIDAANVEVAKFKSENATLIAKMAEQDKAIKADKVKMARDAATAIIEAAVRAKKITPAQRLSFTKLFKLDNDDAVLALDLKDVELHTQTTQDDANKILAAGKSAFSKQTRTGDDSALSDGAEEHDAFQSEFTQACATEAAKSGKSIFASMTNVVRMNPKLGKRFLNDMFDSGEAA